VKQVVRDKDTAGLSVDATRFFFFLFQWISRRHLITQMLISTELKLWKRHH